MHLVPFVSSALWWKENLERIRGRDSELWQSRFHDGQDCSLVHTTSSSKDLEFQQWLLQVVIQREGWGFPQTSGSGSSLEPLLRATLQMYLVKMHIPLSGWFGNHMPWNLDLNRLGTNQDVDKMLVIVIAQKQEKRSGRLPVLFRGSFWGHTQNSWKWIGEVTTSVLYLHTSLFPSALKICSTWTRSHTPGKPLLMLCTSLSRWLRWSSQCT